jgi:ribosomal protein S18 acetylase RimI-like enzyme
MGAVVIRPAATDEIEGLRRLEKEARLPYKTIADLQFVADLPPISFEWFVSGSAVVAEVEGRVTGFAVSKVLDGNLYLANISVMPEAAGRGIGRALLNEALKLAKEHVLPSVVLTTFKSPTWNGPWFRRCGFVPMPQLEIGDELRAVLGRQAKVFDMSTRDILWRQIMLDQPSE